MLTQILPSHRAHTKLLPYCTLICCPGTGNRFIKQTATEPSPPRSLAPSCARSARTLPRLSSRT